MSDLRAKIERGEYSVDSGIVAGSMLRKIEVVDRVRRQMLAATTEAGRIQPRSERVH